MWQINDMWLQYFWFSIALAKRLQMIHANMKRSRGISHSKEDRQRFSLVSIYNYNIHVELPIYELIISL